MNESACRTFRNYNDLPSGCGFADLKPAGLRVRACARTYVKQEIRIRRSAMSRNPLESKGMALRIPAGPQPHRSRKAAPTRALQAAALALPGCPTR